jgi:uncharacterized protein (DUF1810 family)
MKVVDPYDLNRFVEAQEDVYESALAEIRAGQKRSHWMWFVFPQIAGLGSSPISRKYAIRRLDEARAYLDHPILGLRLLDCVDAVLAIDGKSASEIFGYPDDLKLRSSATLFAAARPDCAKFQRLLERYFDGKHDPRTLSLLI